MATLPLAAVGFAAFWLWSAWFGGSFAMPFGPTPVKFVLLMCTIGLLSSWLQARPARLVWVHRCSGAILIGLGLRLAFEKR